jgi:phage-related protein
MAPALAQVQKRLDRNPLKIKLVVDTTGFLADARRAIRDAETTLQPLRISLDVDTAHAVAMAVAAHKDIEAATSNAVTQEVKVDVDHTASQRIAQIGNAVSSIAAAAGTIGAVTAGIAAITGAAGAALGAVGGLAIGLASLGPAAAAIGATAVVGLHGIVDTFKALATSTANAAADTRTHTKAVAAAQTALASASNSAESAQHSLNSAQKDAASAARAVGDAYKTAQERLDNYQSTLKGASLDEREAALSLKEAQIELGKATLDPIEHEKALLRVERAELNLTKAQKANTKLQKEAASDQAKGVAGSKEVVAAKSKQADADSRVTEAARGAAVANQQVATAAVNLSEAQKAALPSVQKFNDKLAELSPNAQSFVLAAKDIAPALDAAAKPVQNNLFANLGAQLKETSAVILPAMSAGMRGVATELNLAAVNALEFLRSTQGMALVNASFDSGIGLLKGLREGTGELTKGWIDFTTTAAPAMEGVGKALAGVGEGIGAALSTAKNNGDLSKLFAGFQQALIGLKPLLDAVFSTFIILGKDVLPALKPLFEAIGAALKAIAPSLGQIGALFADALTAIIPTLAVLIKALAEGLKPVLPIIADLLKAIGVAITPLIEPFSRIAVLLGETLVQTVNALAPALVPLATAFNDVLTAVAPLVPLLAESLAAAVVALAPALSQIAIALAPIIKSFAEGLTPVIKQIAPVLAQTALILGTALADALTQLSPILPPLVTAFTNLLIAVVPLLPEMAKFAAEVIPPLVAALVELAPSIIRITDGLTWLITNVIVPLVIPIIREMAQVFKDNFQTIADVVKFLTEGVFPKIGEAIDKVKGFFSAGVEAIKTIWAGIQDAAAIPVNFVIDTVWNNGLLKAWRSVDSLLGGVLPDASPLATIPHRATGGPIGSIFGSGNGTKDDILTWMSNGEHVVTAKEVLAAGGQNILFAIRDMIARGIPFTWDNGKIITDLGKDNLSLYGSKVATAGIGNVPPEGLFDQLARVPIPQFASGGQIMPWMYQLQKGHAFARAQDGKPYQWAGPRFVGDSFDCSGFMAAIAAKILGTNPWQRYWSTSSFNGQQVGPQGFTRSLTQGSGFGIGVSNGGPGGGHTGGELRGVPELSLNAARVESGGAIGNVHYGRGTDPNSFQMQYGLPIGANGFFQPAPGGISVGPSTSEQSSFLSRTIERILHAATSPVRELINSTIGAPPPSVRGIPLSVLDSNEKAFADFMSKSVGSLGGLLGGAWQKATSLGDKVLDFVNPFDDGGIAGGTGFIPKNVIAPERVLSPEQTALFESLVLALQKIASSGLTAASQAANKVIVDISAASITALQGTLGVNTKPAGIASPAPEIVALQESFKQAQLTTGELLSDTRATLERTATSQEISAAKIADDTMKALLGIAGKLSGEVLTPLLTSAVTAGTAFINSLFEGVAKQIVGGTDRTTRAVNNLGGSLAAKSTGTATPAFGAPGSAFDFAGSLSTAVVSISNAASAAFKKVGDDVIAAALKQKASTVGTESRGKLGGGADQISGGFLADMIVSITGVDIEIRDLLSNTLDQVRKFRGESTNAFDDAGALISDTAVLVDRNQSSIELAAKEQERIQKALIKAVIKYLIVNILIPIITAILSAMITLATTAIGAAIGSAIPVVGTAIGAAVGAAVGAALSGLAVTAVAGLAVGAGAALDAFDEGGIASGFGMMRKGVIEPERVLSPRQTASFEQLVHILDRGRDASRIVQIGSMNVHGRDPAKKTADNLLALLAT